MQTPGINDYKQWSGYQMKRYGHIPMTFEEWSDLWIKSGKWAQRGKHTGEYQMVRKNYDEPLSPANAHIILTEEAVANANKARAGRNAYAAITHKHVPPVSLLTDNKTIDEAIREAEQIKPSRKVSINLLRIKNEKLHKEATEQERAEDDE